MNGLPTKTNGGVSVRSLDRRSAIRGQAPRPCDRPRTARRPKRPRMLPLKLLRFPVVRERTGLSRSTIWRLERRGEFPKHHRISPNVVAWVEEDVTSWIELRTSSVAS